MINGAARALRALRSHTHHSAATSTSVALTRRLSCAPSGAGSRATAWNLGALGAAGLACAALAAPHLPTLLLRPSLGEAPQQQLPPGAEQAEQAIAAFRTWLRSQGVAWEAVDVGLSQAGEEEKGCGLFATAGLKRATAPLLWQRLRAWLGYGQPAATAATFPAALAICGPNIVRDPLLGPQYGAALAQGLIDERTAILLYLLVERLRGSSSPLAPYMAMLPTSFHTPLYYTPEELAQLRGTPMAAAAAAVRARLHSSWQKLAPEVSTMLRAAGVQATPDLDDFLWAHSIFWSRGHTLPVPRRPGATTGSAAGPHEVDVLDAVIPGLDFCNHSFEPQCWWEVERARAGSSGERSSLLDGVSIQLRVNRRCAPAAGEELLMSYGDKSNEELLLLHGFAQLRNPNDYIMLHAPLPPQADWDPVTAARVELLHSWGLKPRFFLRPCSSSSSAGGSAGGTPAAAVSSSTESHSADAWWVLPMDALQVLHAFVMTPAELAAALEEQQQQQPEVEQNEREGRQQQQQQAPSPEAQAQAGRRSTSDLQRRMAALQGSGLAASSDAEAASLLMACLTLLGRLLEIRVTALEGEGGTGSLENDQERIEAHLRASSAARADEAEPTAAAGSQAAPDLLPPRHWAALVYRAEQKRMTREHLVAARRRLQQVVGRLRQLQPQRQ